MLKLRKILAGCMTVIMTVGLVVLPAGAYGYNGDEKALFRDAILYSDISGALSTLQAKNPAQMKVDRIGKSATGKDLFCVTMTDSQGMSKLSKYMDFMQGAVKDPDAALASLRGDVRIPVFINGSIHGDEISGTDGILSLINRLQTDKDDPYVQKVLSNCIVIFNVVQNPDGRIKGVRENGNGFDLNRDYFTQSQPETTAVVKNIFTKWFPTITVDMHGYTGSGNVSIDACTIPHNPNYEYDLVKDNMLAEVQIMANEITSATKIGVDIPALTMADGWDDYTPIYTPQYGMFMGLLGNTVEVQYPDEEGAKCEELAAWGALKFAADNKLQLLRDYLTVFSRGVNGIDVEKDIAFPYAYVISTTNSPKNDGTAAADAIKHLQNNAIQVEQAAADFSADGKIYPAGTYIVPMRQSLRGLANTMLWAGEDVSDISTAMYDISAYSFPQLCGFEAIAIHEAFNFDKKDKVEITYPAGSFTTGKGGTYAIKIVNNDAIKAANALYKEGYAVSRAMSGFGDYAAGTFLVTDKSGLAARLEALSKEYSVDIAGVGKVNIPTYPVKMERTAVVGDNGGAYQVLKDLGFDVGYVCYTDLNHCYDLEDAGYKALIITGLESGCWANYDDEGYSYGYTWALRERGRQELIEFINEGHDLIGSGMSGMRLNENTGRMSISYAYTDDGEGGQTSENGIVKMYMDGTDPLAYSYNGEITAYAYAPIWFTSYSGATAGGKFPVSDFYLAGFWKNPEAAADKAIMLHDQGQFDTVMLGIDPTFRAYTPVSYRVMANAMYYVCYDLK